MFIPCFSKQNSLGTVLFISILFIFSCRKDLAIKNPASSPHSVQDAMFDLFKEAGFHNKDIVDLGNYLVVDKDVMFKKDSTSLTSIKNYYHLTSSFKNNKENNNSHLRARGVVAANKVKVIKVYNRDNIWNSSLTQAMANWAAIDGTDINFFLTSDPVYADVIVEGRDDIPYGILGLAEVPSYTIGPSGTIINGDPGELIYVNTKYNSYTFEQKLGVLMHEIGHTLGLLHTEYSEDGNGHGTLIPGTPQFDALSVMNGSGPLHTIFSNFDVIAATYLFPATPIVITYPYGKYPNNFVQTTNSMQITWNTTLASGAGMRQIDLLQKGIVKKTYYNYNTGSITISNFLPYLTGTTVKENLQIRMTNMQAPYNLNVSSPIFKIIVN